VDAASVCGRRENHRFAGRNCYCSLFIYICFYISIFGLHFLLQLIILCMELPIPYRIELRHAHYLLDFEVIDPDFCGINNLYHEI
jgi:hypothetical protein